MQIPVLNAQLEYLMMSWLLSLNSTSGASVVAIDNKIEQAMVKYFFYYFNCLFFEGRRLIYLQKDTASYDVDTHSWQASPLTCFVPTHTDV